MLDLKRTKPDYTVKSIEKAVSILDVFSPERLNVSLNEIQEILGMPKATVFRIVYTLEKCGLLRRDNSSGTFCLGLKILYLGNLIAVKQDIVEIALPIMAPLRDETGETVDLTILDGNQILYIAKLDSNHRLKASSGIGKKLPLHCTASGKLLAAYTNKIPGWPPNTLTAYTSKTITDIDILQTELQTIRDKGYAVDMGELDEGIVAVSAPIWINKRNVAAALTIVAPESRVDNKTFAGFIAKVKKSAAEISAELEI